MIGHTPPPWLREALSLCLLLPLCACGDEPIHASALLAGGGGTGNTHTPIPLADTGWTAFLTVDEPWMAADTEAKIWFYEQDGDVFKALVFHEEGTLVVDGHDIESGQSNGLSMEGQLIRTTDPVRVHLEIEDFGHTLVFNGDLFGTSQLEGYFVVDDKGEVWAEFSSAWHYW